MSRLHFPRQSVIVGLLSFFVIAAAAEALYASGNYNGGFSRGSRTSEGIPDLRGAGDNGRTRLPGRDTSTGPGRTTRSTPPGRTTTSTGPGRYTTGTAIPFGRPWSNPGTNRTTRPPARPPVPVYQPLPPIKRRPVMTPQDLRDINRINREIQDFRSERERLRREAQGSLTDSQWRTKNEDYRDAGEDIWKRRQDFFGIKNRYIDDPTQKFQTENEYFQPFDSLPRGRSSTGAP